MPRVQVLLGSKTMPSPNMGISKAKSAEQGGFLIRYQTVIRNEKEEFSDNDAVSSPICGWGYGAPYGAAGGKSLNYHFVHPEFHL